MLGQVGYSFETQKPHNPFASVHCICTFRVCYPTMFKKKHANSDMVESTLVWIFCLR